MIQVLEGDCLDLMLSMDSNTVDCVITSPPYNLDIKYKTYKDQRLDYLPWMNTVCEAIHRVMKPGGHLFLQMGGTASNPLIPHQVLSEALKYFKLQNQIVWVKHIALGTNS